MYISRKHGLARRVLVEIAVALLIVVWIAPVSLIALAISDDSLRASSESVDRLCEKSKIFETFIASLQPLALLALMSLLPPILTALGIFEGCISMSQVQFRSFFRYFNFQVINVLFVTVIAGSVLNSAKNFIESPRSIFHVVGETLPNIGAFFCVYIMFKAFVGLGVELVRLTCAIGALIKTCCTPNVTPRDRDRNYGVIRNMSNAGWLPLAKIYAQDMLVVVISLVYANLAPLVIAMSLCYFWGASIVYTHQMLFVYDPVFESGGGMWPRLASRFTFGLIVAQFTMISMLIMKQVYGPLLLLSPTLALTFLYSARENILHNREAIVLPLEAAISLDMYGIVSPTPIVDTEKYLQPGIREDVTLAPIAEDFVTEACGVIDNNLS